jgi:hypothetical protein
MRRKAEPSTLGVRGIRHASLDVDRERSADTPASTMDRLRHARVEREAGPQQHRAEIGAVETIDGLAGEPDVRQGSVTLLARIARSLAEGLWLSARSYQKSHLPRAAALDFRPGTS